VEVRTSAAPVYSEVFAKLVSASWKLAAPGAVITGGTVNLLKGTPDPLSPKTDLADFTALEADFTDYVAPAAALLVNVNLGQNVEGATQTAVFTMTTDPAVTANTITGYYVVDAVGNLAVYEIFEVPVQMAEYGDQLVLVIQLPVQSYQTPTGLPA